MLPQQIWRPIGNRIRCLRNQRASVFLINFTSDKSDVSLEKDLYIYSKSTVVNINLF